MKAIMTIWLMVCCLTVHAEQFVPFRSEDQKLKVYRMDSVLILADSAYVISSARALLLNEKLSELHSAYYTNAKLIDINAALLEKVMEIERLVRKLMQRMQVDQSLVSLNINDLLTELDLHIQQLHNTNVQLDHQNTVLKDQLNAMEQTIKRLKRAIRTMWWRTALEKILIGLAGFGIGWGISR